jgi:hypothetical protein
MRTRLRGKISLLFLTCAMLLSIPAIAWASGDQFQDTLVGAATTQTITAGGSFTNTYYVDAGGSDGCDATTATPAVFSINAPSVVSKSPTTNLSFTGCGIGNSQTVTFSSSTPSGSSGYTISASRVSGSVTSAGQAGFTLIVNSAPAPSDTTKPVLNLPSNITKEATGSSGAAVTYSADATDNVDGNIAANCLPVSGSTFAIATTTVNCSATDAAGNKATGSFTVTVQDTTAPSISGTPSDITKEATGANGAIASWTAPTASDTVDGSVNVNCQSASGLKSGDTFALGDTTVTCTATDNAGNKATSTFKVTVVDTTGPSITNVPSDKTVEATSDAGATVIFTIPTANDAVDGSRTVTCKPDSGSTFSLGLTEVTCTASDASGNTTSAKFNVMVQDTTAPSIATHDDITGVEATGPDGAKVTYASPTATDNVDTSVTVNCTPASGSTFGLSDNTVTCTATDNAGNTATSHFKVTVVDTTAPTLHLPANITEEATGPNGKAVSFTATATDLVDGNMSANCTPASGSTFAIGTTTVNCSATDAAGNKATGSFTVKVQDTTVPSLNLPANITEEAAGPNGNVVTYSASANDVVDGSVSVNCTPASGSTFAIGTTTVNCSATDAAGNKATGSFTVKVQDTIAPSNIQFVGNISDGDSFYFGAVPAQPTCTATDGGSGLQSCVVSGYSTAVGQHTLKATATDKAGNTATREISYTVKSWTTRGFYAPVDMGGVVNTVKGGSTVPLKFELFSGATELTDTSAIKSLTATKTNCEPGATEDAIEVTATGGTSLRYDSTGGQFIYNWKTPTGAGCYTVTMTAQDGSTITAYFKSLK